jgi:predicted DNA-binding transcriptional regulator AlpA
MTQEFNVHKEIQKIYSEQNDKSRYQKLLMECESGYDWKKAHGKNRPFLTPKELGDFLSISIKTLQRWRTEGLGPKFIKVGTKRIRYSFKDLDDWAQSQASE